MAASLKSCSLDSVPTFLVRELIDVLLPYITLMVNASLAHGRQPASQKRAIVTSLLKKPGLESTDMNNFRLVSNVSFVSKVVERAVASQLNDYLAHNDLLPRCQSPYRKGYSTETALLRVWSDMLMSVVCLYCACSICLRCSIVSTTRSCCAVYRSASAILASYSTRLRRF